MTCAFVLRDCNSRFVHISIQNSRNCREVSLPGGQKQCDCDVILGRCKVNQKKVARQFVRKAKKIANKNKGSIFYQDISSKAKS